MKAYCVGWRILMHKIEDPDINWIKTYTCTGCDSRWSFGHRNVQVRQTVAGEFSDDAKYFWMNCPDCGADTCVGNLLRYGGRVALVQQRKRYYALE
jgi:hypothetical protein